MLLANARRLSEKCFGSKGMGETTKIQVGCKINLMLRIVGKRSDGWHELDSVLLPLPEPHDVLELTLKAETGGFACRCSAADIAPGRNTLIDAYEAYAQQTGFRPELEAVLYKGIPRGAGLGGGSADAAALLLWLNTNTSCPLSFEAMRLLAARVGADVPFFLYNRPCRVSGIGEHLEPCSPEELLGLGRAHLVLACPPVAVSTPWAYKAWDTFTSFRLTGRSEARIEKTSRGVVVNRKTSGSSLFWIENHFEVPVFEVYPRLRRLKETFLRQGAYASAMSGSGASIFGLFRAQEAAQRCVESFREKGMAVFSHTM